MSKYATEAALCADFIKHLPPGWKAYPETAGFDILLVRLLDGFQIGIEAKLKLNAKAICQAAEPIYRYFTDFEGPDCRAILLPYDGFRGELKQLLPLLHITPILFGEDDYEIGGKRHCHMHPSLPPPGDTWADENWYELCPARRCELPKYVPDVQAGCPAPVMLTEWKVKAIKIAILLERQGFVTRHDFKKHKINMTMWTQRNWISINKAVGGWVKTERMPDFRVQHPLNYAQVEADFEDWK